MEERDEVGEFVEEGVDAEIVDADSNVDVKTIDEDVVNAELNLDMGANVDADIVNHHPHPCRCLCRCILYHVEVRFPVDEILIDGFCVDRRIWEMKTPGKWPKSPTRKS